MNTGEVFAICFGATFIPLLIAFVIYAIKNDLGMSKNIKMTPIPKKPEKPKQDDFHFLGM